MKKITTILFSLTLFMGFSEGLKTDSELEKDKLVFTKQAQAYYTNIFDCSENTKMITSPNLTDEGSWTKKEQADFMETCKKSPKENLTEDGVRIYCDCILVKLMKKYKSAEDAQNITPAEKAEMGKECMSY